MPSNDLMAAMVARRFAPLDFYEVTGFPHSVPPSRIQYHRLCQSGEIFCLSSEWGDFLPIFGEKKEYIPAHHLIKFYECMDLLDLQHKDVHMKMFMYSLDGDAREWYFSLPPSSISSLKDFHTVFYQHYKRYFSWELLLQQCCEKFKSYI